MLGNLQILHHSLEKKTIDWSSFFKDFTLFTNNHENFRCLGNKDESVFNDSISYVEIHKFHTSHIICLHHSTEH